jgi:hypothetical protein
MCRGVLGVKRGAVGCWEGTLFKVHQAIIHAQAGIALTVP